ncbi:PREDICTED: 28S ribosomal protein S26, mitochondrial isoform X2 [Colobus angolensis palliatus]|uniref:28S ribosomal protein S26, mitochondrial isoform X2 n=1 Tax=Colobus angolensis palliatus TaxID=336983 RepID=UPI0005F3E43D|nr:PREDICTED: 28S ribosomal protein S26, mitochondrial isoform X2 [Colobus angolensis palliatus]
MLRALSRLGAGTPCGPRAPLVLPARGRKTRYDPPAKSKIGRVNMPPPVDPAEFFVLMERYQHYRQTVRALRMEFVSEVRRKAYEARAGVLAERKALKYATEHRELMAWNQEENRRLHNLRCDSEAAAGGTGAGAAAGVGAGPQGRRGAGLGAAQGTGSAAAAGRGEKFHHPREPGGTGGSSIGLSEELQLGHHQRGAGGQVTTQGLLGAQ